MRDEGSSSWRRALVLSTLEHWVLPHRLLNSSQKQIGKLHESLVLLLSSQMTACGEQPVHYTLAYSAFSAVR